MRNVILSSAFSQLNTMGPSDIQLLNVDVPSQTANNYGFCMESNMFNNDSQMKGGGFNIPCQYPFSYQSGISRTDNDSPLSMLFTKKTSLPQSESNKKRMKAGASEHGLPSLVQEESDATQDLRDIDSSDNILKIQVNNIRKSVGTPLTTELHAPVRRSQRLSDKITALQKLVSPYGKTDSASVLQEACLYIKLLQGHIQNLIRMQSGSYKSLNPQGIGQMREDLRSRGLCLVPVTFDSEK